jgi:quercetin dioxygenase-like cupin family protein
MPTVEAFATADVSEIGAWLLAIPESEWPGMADPAWHGADRLLPRVAEELMQHFPGCALSGVGLFLLAAGQEHPAHTDEQPPDWVTRVHVPIVTNPRATVTTDDGTMHMEAGTAYRVNTRERHAVRNDGETPRVHLVFDVKRRSDSGGWLRTDP